MTKRRYILSLLVLIGTMLLPCLLAAQNENGLKDSVSNASRRRNTFPLMELAHFPLNPGSEWTYTNGQKSYTVKVSSSSSSGMGREADCHQLENYLFPFIEGVDKVRTFPPGEVTDCAGQGINGLWYRFWGMEGSRSWIFSPNTLVPCVSGSRVTMVSSTDSVETPAGLFDECIHLVFYSTCRDNGITDEYFAPGVGLVRRVVTTFAGPVVYDLASARLRCTKGRWGLGMEVSINQPVYFNNWMPPVADPSPQMKARLLLYNATKTVVALEYPTSQRFDFVVYDLSGQEWMRWSDRMNFLQGIGRETLDEGWIQIYSVVFTLADRNRKPLPSGEYVLSGYLACRKGSTLPLQPFAGSVRFQIKDVH